MKDQSHDMKQTVDKKRTAVDLTAVTDAAVEERIEEKIDRDLRDSFPASDPPGWTLGVERRVK